MYETYENLAKVAELYDGPTDLTELAFDYQFTEDPAAFAYAYRKVFGVSINIAKNAFGLTYEDKASFVSEELHKALMDYEGGKVYFKQFYSTYLSRRLYAETNMNNTNKRKANSPNASTAYSDVTEAVLMLNNERYDVVDLLESIEKTEELSTLEKAYCSIVAGTTGEMSKNNELAKTLGVSPPALVQLRKRLAKKLPMSLLTV